MPADRQLEDVVVAALRRCDAEKCAQLGHDWFQLNWIGTGHSESYCRRCTVRVKDGKVVEYARR